MRKRFWSALAVSCVSIVVFSLAIVVFKSCRAHEEWHEWDDRAGSGQVGWSENDLIRNNGEPDYRIVGFNRLAESLSDTELRSVFPVKNIPSCAPLDMPYSDFIMRCAVQGNVWKGKLREGKYAYDEGWYLKPPATTDVLLIYAEDLRFAIDGPPDAYIHIFREGKYHDIAYVFPWNSSLCDLARVSVED